jgi:hypothetical protein
MQFISPNPLDILGIHTHRIIHKESSPEVYNPVDTSNRINYGEAGKYTYTEDYFNATPTNYYIIEPLARPNDSSLGVQNILLLLTGVIVAAFVFDGVTGARILPL